MRRTVAGGVLAVILIAGLLSVGAGSAAGQPADNATVNCTYPIEVTDANGATVTVKTEPEDVVVLAPSAAQVLWDIGAQEKVVGMPVKYYTDYLNGSTEKTNVVTEHGQPVTEKILSLKPDLVLAPNVISSDAVQQLRNNGLTVYRFRSANSIGDVVEKTRLTGRLVGKYDAARTVSARTQATLDAYQSATEGAKRPTVLYWMGGGYTAGQETFIGDVIDAAGGENIATAANISTYDVINNEVIVNQDPDWIVVPKGVEVPTGPKLNGTTAIQDNQIVRVNRNFMNQPGPRVTQPLEQLAKAFHPDATADVTVDPASVSSPICAADAVTPTQTATQTTTETTTSTDSTVTLETNQTMGTANQTIETTTGATTETTTTTGPGFGVIAAIVAFVSAGLVMWRR